jgi:tetratricopeptide (TPR) repeat protein
MLFDLRGRGRRRTVQVIYLGLAVLLGGGLVLFGIGGDVQGGLFDAFREGSGSAKGQIEQRREKALERTKANPRDAAAWSDVAQAEYQLAGQSKGYNANATDPEQAFTGEARKHLEAAKRAWERHLAVAGDNPDPDLAGTMRNALTSLGDMAGAVRAQEIILDSRDKPGFGDYGQLAFLAYQAGQTRKGDLAADRALELAPKDQREALKQSLDAAKAQAGAATSTTPTPAPTTTPGS